MKSTVILVGEKRIKIELSDLMEKKCGESGLTEDEVYSMVLKIGEGLLEFNCKFNRRFQKISLL